MDLYKRPFVVVVVVAPARPLRIHIHLQLQYISYGKEVSGGGGGVVERWRVWSV